MIKNEYNSTYLQMLAKREAMKIRAERIATQVGISYQHIETFHNGIGRNKSISELRKYHVDKVSEFLERFYGRENDREEEHLPNGQELGKFFFKLMFQIPWFRPEREYSSTDLIEEARTTINSFGLEGKFRILVSKNESISTGNRDFYDNDFGCRKRDIPPYVKFKIPIRIESGVSGNLHDVISNIVGETILSYKHDWNMVEGNIMAVGDDVTNCANYILGQNSEGLREIYLTNPFMTLFDGFYSKGLYPLGISRKTSWFGWGSKTLAVFHPPVDEVKIN